MARTSNPLGDFLRSRRARLSPESVGIVNKGRRRPTGLRRVQVTEFAGISVTGTRVQSTVATASDGARVRGAVEVMWLGMAIAVPATIESKGRARSVVAAIAPSKPPAPRLTGGKGASLIVGGRPNNRIRSPMAQVRVVLGRRIPSRTIVSIAAIRSLSLDPVRTVPFTSCKMSFGCTFARTRLASFARARTTFNAPSASF
jgi:hypothetical protein